MFVTSVRVRSDSSYSDTGVFTVSELQASPDFHPIEQVVLETEDDPTQGGGTFDQEPLGETKMMRSLSSRE
jgi:hypothetical protein